MWWSRILIILGLGINYTQGIWPPSYKVDLEDKKTFVLFSDEDYDENENEMIQREDLSDFESFAEDEPKYEPLHSHVKNYNRRVAEKAEKLSRNFPFPMIKEAPFKEEPKPFIAGFKSSLDKYAFESLENSDNSLKKRSPGKETTITKPTLEKLFSLTSGMKNPRYVKNNYKRIKRSEDDYPFESTDSSKEFFEGLDSQNSTTGETTESEKYTEKVDFGNVDLTIRTTVSEDFEYHDELEETSSTERKEEMNFSQFGEKTTASSIETSEDYDYDKMNAEYYQQIEGIQKRNESFTYTERGEPEDTIKDAVKKIVDFKMPRNCTKEELSQIGVKAFECLIYDYQHAKNKTDVKKVLDRSWVIIKIWILIYICVAIPCWCQKGWCCCCFCCEFCFPKEIISSEKKYFAENPPGTLVKRIKEDNKVKIETVNFKPTLFEYEAYEKLQSAIRNI